MSTSLQIGIEKQRALYEQLSGPLLSQIAALHRVSVRDFASIFGVSKSHAQEILNHRKFPSLELAIKMARYWEVSVEELFGWRVDDDGDRRPLLIELPRTGQLVTLSSKGRDHGALELVAEVARQLRERR